MKKCTDVVTLSMLFKLQYFLEQVESFSMWNAVIIYMKQLRASVCNRLFLCFYKELGH